MKIKTLSIVIIVFLSLGLVFYNGNDVYFEISKNLEIFSKIYKEISFNYVDEINSSEFIKAGIRGMLDKLDPYTALIDESNKSDVDIMTNGKYGGIGVSIGVLNNKVKITEIMDGYPAQRQGLRIGDIILEVDGFKVSVENYNEVSPRVKGKPGTQLKLKVLRNNQKDTLIFQLIREEILLKSLIYYGFYPPNSNNVYLKLNSFNKTVAAEIQNAIKKLKNEREIKSVVLDLRGNPGGLLESAIEVSDKFLQKNLLIVSTRGRDENSERKFYSTEEPLFKDEKVVVLINENSASASEIVAGAIQDHDRGIILGTQSFGKGLVQTITPITNEVSLKITTAKYYTPSGRCIQKIDYFKNNKVVKGLDLDSTSDFFTDNSRKVFSAGGITPDTLVESIFKNSFTEELLAQGLIFEYVDSLISSYNSENFEKDSDKNIFQQFLIFVSNNSDRLKTESTKKMNDLITQIKKDSSDDSIIKDLMNTNKKLENQKISLLEKNKSTILSLIKTELAKRYYDSRKSLEESLKNDNQVITALNILSNENIYFKILNKH